MPTAICLSCGKDVEWRNQRGSKLAYVRCACGGSCRKMTSEEISIRINESWEDYNKRKLEQLGAA